MITEVYHEHEKLLEKMYGNFEVEKRELEDQKKELSYKIEEMNNKHKLERKRIEEQKWEEIETLKEKNKEELADRIDKGMLEKASLTLVTNDHKLRNNKKLGEEKLIADLDQRLKDEINQFNTKKAQLKSQINELAERETTIRDKDSKIRDLYKKT